MQLLQTEVGEKHQLLHLACVLQHRALTQDGWQPLTRVARASEPNAHLPREERLEIALRRNQQLQQQLAQRTNELAAVRRKTRDSGPRGPGNPWDDAGV